MVCKGHGLCGKQWLLRGAGKGFLWSFYLQSVSAWLDGDCSCPKKKRDIYPQETANVPGPALAQAKIFALAATELQHQVNPSSRWIGTFKDISIPFPCTPPNPLVHSRPSPGGMQGTTAASCCNTLWKMELSGSRKEKGMRPV